MEADTNLLEDHVMKKTIAGNWKMHKTIPDAVELISAVAQETDASGMVVNIVVCPAFIALNPVAEIVRKSNIHLGAQNMHHQDSGAYTGECSAEMLKSAGCKYVILGHSERRHIFKEQDWEVNLKMCTAIRYGLKPILCVGETESERDMDLTYNVIERQLRIGLKGIAETSARSVVIAYEPVWAIGTGRTAAPGQAREAHDFIRNFLIGVFGDSSKSIPLLYGGSVKPDNARELLIQTNIDGALVGGASLKADSFLELVTIAAQV
jgi:triosephosphate isomerase (TIM)